MQSGRMSRFAAYTFNYLNLSLIHPRFSNPQIWLMREIHKIEKSMQFLQIYKFQWKSFGEGEIEGK